MGNAHLTNITKPSICHFQPDKWMT
ncbi:hypothetical protein CY0110_18747 [Crocosphaera chwakensis CCY0110]|uniref:Uncharacterized protein n=1 Tax=Crocosphaera chwakensis CCY0110 TaxID=391612 RepID=A3IJ81_9CHRO|nr:hypothetical protein CY0110_18747 [Crocosphaera chwakensis CCY0110]